LAQSGRIADDANIPATTCLDGNPLARGEAAHTHCDIVYQSVEIDELAC
jgi:hypothetical protein